MTAGPCPAVPLRARSPGRRPHGSGTAGPVNASGRYGRPLPAPYRPERRGPVARVARYFVTAASTSAKVSASTSPVSSRTSR